MSEEPPAHKDSPSPSPSPADEFAGKPERAGLLTRLRRADRNLVICWLFNAVLTLGLIFWWGGLYQQKKAEHELTMEIVYRLSRFMNAAKELDAEQAAPVEFFISPGRAPHLFPDEIKELWEVTPRSDILFSWQNERFGMQRGIVISAEDKRLLQRIDSVYDDGDLGQGTARIHPLGLWLAIR